LKIELMLKLVAEIEEKGLSQWAGLDPMIEKKKKDGKEMRTSKRGFCTRSLTV